MSKILVTVPSRNRPGQLAHTLSLIESRAYSKENYDLQIVLNDDQWEDYAELRNQYSHIQWVSVPYVKRNMRLIYVFQFDYFLKNSQYSLLWYLPDDLLEIPKRWDKLINKSSVFPDNLFCIHSQCLRAGRRIISYQSCYTRYDGISKKVKAKMHDEFITAYHIGERFPAYSRKWVEYLLKIYTHDNHIIAHDIVSACIIRILFDRYRINRHIPGIGENLDCVDDKITDKIVKRNPFNRKIVHDICSEMRDYIMKNHTS